MGLTINNYHIIYYHIDATQSVGLVLTYFTKPDYLAVQGWVQATFLFSDTVNQMILMFIIMLRSFQGRLATCLLVLYVTALWL